MSQVALTEDFLGAFGLYERDGSVLLAGNRRRLAPDAEPELVFDLPGGRVEPGEMLHEALRREWREETGLAIEVGEFLLVQEGVRKVDGVRHHVWRSFFFRVRADGEPRPLNEVESLLWCPHARLDEVLVAQYHLGFRRWLEDGGPFQQDVWD